MRQKKLFLSLGWVYKLLSRQKGFRLVQTLDRSRCLMSQLLTGPRTKQLTSLRHLSTERIFRNLVAATRLLNFDLANSFESLASKLNAFWPVRVQGCGPVTRAFQSPRRDETDLLSLDFFPQINSWCGPNYVQRFSNYSSNNDAEVFSQNTKGEKYQSTKKQNDHCH